MYRQSVTLQKPRHREYRPNPHFVRLASSGNKAAKDAKRLEPRCCGSLVAHDNGGTRPIRELACVTARDRKSRSFCRLHAGETFCGGVGPRTFILGKGHFLARHRAGTLVHHSHCGLDRNKFVIKPPALLRRRGTSLAFQTVFVLKLTRDVIALGHVLRCVQHCYVRVRLHRKQLRVDRVPPIHMLVLHETDRLAAPPTATSTPSKITDLAATAMACSPDAHCRSIVVPLTLTGSPARNRALRAILVPVVPCCIAQPITTSSTSAPSTFARERAAEIACPSNVAPSVLFSAPL